MRMGDKICDANLWNYILLLRRSLSKIYFTSDCFRLQFLSEVAHPVIRLPFVIWVFLVKKPLYNFFLNIGEVMQHAAVLCINSYTELHEGLHRVSQSFYEKWFVQTQTMAEELIKIVYADSNMAAGYTDPKDSSTGFHGVLHRVSQSFYEKWFVKTQTMAEFSQSVYFSVRLRFSSAVLCVIYLKGLHRVSWSFRQSFPEFLWKKM